MFNEGNTVYLYVVHFGTELNRFGFLATDYGTDIMLVYADYTLIYLMAIEKEHALFKYFPYHGKTALVITRKFQT